MLYAAGFKTFWWVQGWYSFQVFVAMGMGLAGFFFPNSPAITLGGIWTDEKGKKVLAPNVRSWGLRNAIPGLVNILALYFGTREAYLIMCACAMWRESFDILEAIMDGSTAKLFLPAKIAPGKFPPLMYFPPYLFLLAVNSATLYVTLKA